MTMLLTRLLLSSLSIALSIILLEQQWRVVAQEVPCYFIFGDSLVDNGNNNHIPTQAKTNYLPYGIDFPEGPTGRFCNGRTVVDIVGQLLGFVNYIPPFATATGKEILKGVNYGSGSAGILFETAYTTGARISMDLQLKQHQTTITRIEAMLGVPATTSLLNKCIYSVGMGSNDYINNYFMPLAYPNSSLYTPDQFAAHLISKYGQQLQTLYNHGARKVAVYGLGVLGCSPTVKERFRTNGATCVLKVNEAVALFNAKLIALVDDLNSKLAGAKFTYLAVYTTSYSRKSTLKRTGRCCEIVTTSGLCRPLGATCPNRRSYVYWDGFHPTEAANEIIAGAAYKAESSDDAHPFDISQLAALP